MKIVVPKEVHAGEKRVALTPESAKQLQKLGFTLALESGAGAAASFNDDDYRAADVEVVEDTRQLWRDADIVMKVRPPEQHPQLGVDESELLEAGKTLISFIWPAQNQDLMQKLSERKVTVLAMDSVPRISRAQKLDALSSMANIGGYRAIIEAAEHFGRFFTGQITAAGKVPPARVLVIGAGVAGLAAIGTAKGMGAIVRAFDTRPEVREQVQSMDAEFLEVEMDEDGGGSGGYAKEMSDEFIRKEMAIFQQQAEEVDIIVTTALIPGKPAPKLITEAMVKSMRNGSVIVDLAAEQGGNCELTEPGEVVVRHGVTIIGYTDLPSRLATQASQLYATNLRHLLTDLTPDKDGVINVDMDDEVIRGTTVIKDGEITWPPPAPKISATPRAEKAQPAEPPKPKQPLISQALQPVVALIVGGLALFGVGSVAPESFMAHFTVFVLACFVGYMVIWNVTPSLHTPLMSVTNAISSIIIIGALLQVSSSNILLAGLATFAIFITSINIAGGFAVTRRMLNMFRK
ncbi:NAD(P) transhydrogenase subunit alpha [Methylohalomonas lacus]|uniref:NAD(P) transhydrogenase subunit alpha n=1 Tax=Methylohalomonas lacus TaxID=398773 RepID=A0AAE3HJ36_9GAMM|nr:Re/Si-specific NAD(P)(+) transhydrogenase subunit alpha [Methylohalomonas lacus]MCS3902780.1 NAD(P) transhydrogenase subunit alpha [Methylohalomonas lacus]